MTQFDPVPEAAMAGLPVLPAERGELELLLHREFRSRSEETRSSVDAAVRTLARAALEDQSLIREEVIPTIEAMIAAIDAKLSAQINEIIHHEEFQRLEAAWRGLHHLVYNTESDETMKIRVLPVTKKELSRVLRKFKGVAWDQSPLFRKLYEEEYGQLGGEPYGCLIGDFHFDHTPVDVELLANVSKVAAAAHAPFIAAAAPRLMHMDDWQEIANPRDLTKLFQTPEHAAWNALRDSEDSRYLALTLPRFLGRMPWGAETNPVDAFDFEEVVDGGDSSRYLWCNAAYAMGVNINQSFKRHGWLSRIRGVESGGLVENLPVHAFPTDDGGIDVKCPTETAVSDRREAELSKAGLMPLLHRKNTGYGVFIGAQTLNRPAVYEDPAATANAELSARLPYIFASSRFAHYLKCMVRDKIGSFRERHEVEEWLNGWIQQYIHPSPSLASEDGKAGKPLAAGHVEVEDEPDNPGYYRARFFLRPHYQLEGLSVSLRLVSRLPSAAGE